MWWACNGQGADWLRFLPATRRLEGRHRRYGKGRQWMLAGQRFDRNLHSRCSGSALPLKESHRFVAEPCAIERSSGMGWLYIPMAEARGIVFHAPCPIPVSANYLRSGCSLTSFLRLLYWLRKGDAFQEVAQSENNQRFCFYLLGKAFKSPQRSGFIDSWRQPATSSSVGAIFVNGRDVRRSGPTTPESFGLSSEIHLRRL